MLTAQYLFFHIHNAQQKIVSTVDMTLRNIVCAAVFCVFCQIVKLLDTPFWLNHSMYVYSCLYLYFNELNVRRHNIDFLIDSLTD